MLLRSCVTGKPATALLRLMLTVLLITSFTSATAQGADVKEVKKEADRRFDEEDYDGAYKLYSQLVANFPKDPVFNYRLGVCMIYSEPDKKKALPYLKSAAANEEAPKEALFYLGKAYHVNYRFDEAIQQYNKFKTTAPASIQKKLPVDREIEACQNGKRLLSNLTDLEVQSKKVLNENDYFRTYDLKSIGGKLLAKPEEFKTALDKKKKDKSVVFLPRGGGLVFYSSYGTNGESGRDIYTVTRTSGGEYSHPELVRGINTPYDEDYPFLHPDGKSLYFASKGHNSMGGYDIFRSIWDENTNSWGPPVNLEFPINSPDDDFLFVTDSLEKTAYFSTGRQSAPGKIDVLKIKTERKPADVLILAGTVEQETDKQSVESSILVKDLTTGKDLTLVNAEPNGDYILEVPNGGKLLFKVTTPGLNTQSQEVQMPLAKTASSYKQTITYENGKLKIINNFDQAPADDAYLKMLAVIEKKAKLDVNEGQNQLKMPQVMGGDLPVPTKTTEPAVTQQTTAPVASKEKTVQPAPNIDNRTLAKEARQDADESTQEAVQLEKDAEEAATLGQQQKIVADKKLSDGAQALKSAQQISDAGQRGKAINEAEKQIAEAKYEQTIADKVIALGRTLSDDAKAKKQEAILNTQYADELDKVAVSGNPESIKKLEELRTKIDDLDSDKKEKEKHVAENRKTILEKESQVTQIEKINDGLRADLKDNAAAIITKEQELSGARKKKKEEITNDINNLKAERTEKERDLKNNETEIAALKQDIEDLQMENDPKQALATTALLQEEEKTGRGNPGAKSQPEVAAVSTYKPITTNNPQQAVGQLNALEQKIKEDENNTPPTEAFSELRRAREKLKYDIAMARSAAISPGRSQTAPQRAAALTSEAEGIMSEAQTLRAEAKSASPEEKDKKNRSARDKEELANEKLVEAATITATDNYNRFNTGSENLQTLINSGSRQTTARLEAQRLDEESQLAFKQAAEIRAEAAILTTKGAQLGSFSNAEEKEAEALLKQQQGIDLLRKEHPDVQIKVPAETSVTTDLAARLAPVNAQAQQLEKLEVEAYSKTYEEHAAEIANDMNSTSAADLDEEGRASLARASMILQEASEIKKQAEKEPVPAKKSQLLASVTKKQEEGLSILRELAGKTESLASGNGSGDTESVTPEPVEEKTVAVVPTKTIAAVPTRTVEATPAKTLTPEPAKPVASSTPTNKPAAQTAVAQKTEAPPTPTLASYLQQQKPTLNNGAAKETFEKSLAELASVEKQLQGNDAAAGSPNDLRKQSEDALQEADKLSGDAQQIRTKANDQTGIEKEKSIARAKEQEKKSQVKLLEAATLSEKANGAEITSNDTAIEELLERLKSDDPDKMALISQRMEETTSLRNQAVALRQEASTLSTPAQQLGGMNNAEEKEAEILEVQKQVLDELREQYPDYVQPGQVAAAPVDKAALTQKKYTLLTDLTNALNLEFEGSKNNVDPNLTAAQKTKRKSAFDNNTRSKQLLVQASKTNDPLAKEKLLTDATKAANTALADLKSLPEAPPVAANNTKTGKETNNNNTVAGNVAKNNNTAPDPTTIRNNTPSREEVKTNSARTTARIEGLEVIKGNAYNSTRKIPFDVPAGDGLIFRVQIGAFRVQLPDDAFKGLNPLNGETTTNGYFRYTAGNFNKVENANAVKNDLRKLGYNDAFVVAYFNGKRITVAEALELMAKEGRTVDANAPETAGITASSNVPKPAAVAATQPVTIAKELERTNGLLYTIQIGVFNKQVTGRQLFNLLPVYREQLGNGLYRYTAGIYNNADRLLADKQKVVALGINDAFVSAYINGRRVPFAEARNRQQNDKTIKPEQENPIVFPGASAPPAQIFEEVKPFTNGVKNYPAPTSENGVKTNEDGVTFKVQIGAFSKEVPDEVAARFSKIRNWPVEYKQVNNLYIYNAGNFSEARFARDLKDEAVRLGITDAFVAVYRDGKKLYGAEAAGLLSR
jgi:hypothetical protein